MPEPIQHAEHDKRSVPFRPFRQRKMTTERLQIDFDSEKMREIEALMKEAKVSTKKEFVNWALTLLKWAIKERRAGRIIASVDEAKDSYKELELPILSEMRPR